MHKQECRDHQDWHWLPANLRLGIGCFDRIRAHYPSMYEMIGRPSVLKRILCDWVFGRITERDICKVTSYGKSEQDVAEILAFAIQPPGPRRYTLTGRCFYQLSSLAAHGQWIVEQRLGVEEAVRHGVRPPRPSLRASTAPRVSHA